MIDEEDLRELEIRIEYVEECLDTSDNFDEFRACLKERKRPKTYRETRKSLSQMAKSATSKKP